MYYLSAEFLMGRTLTNAVNNLDMANVYRNALITNMGITLEEICAQVRIHRSLWGPLPALNAASRAIDRCRPLGSKPKNRFFIFICKSTFPYKMNQ